MIGQGIASYTPGHRSGRHRLVLGAGVLTVSLALAGCVTSLGPEPGPATGGPGVGAVQGPGDPEGAAGPQGGQPAQGPRAGGPSLTAPSVGGARLGPAREDQPVPTIGLYTSTSDSVGMEILARLREGIKNAGYFPSTNADRPLLGLHLLSTTPGERSDAPVAYYTVSWTTRDGRFITHMVGSCSMKGATECANALMVTTSQLAQIQIAREQASR